MTEEEKYQRLGRLHALRRVYYDDFDNPTGGSLHVVLDDGNMGDSDLKFCIECAEGNKDHLGIAIARLLLELPEDDREEFYEASQERS